MESVPGEWPEGFFAAALEVRNTSSTPIAYDAWEPDNPVIVVQKRRGLRWQYAYMPGCGFGAHDHFIQPGSSQAMSVWFPRPESSVFGVYRIGIWWCDRNSSRRWRSFARAAFRLH